MLIDIPPFDYSHFEGGLVRMLDRLRMEGTFTGDVEADEYLRREPNAALLGLLYDQRVRAEYAFTGPHRLRDRLGHLDMKRLAAMDPEHLRTLFARKPAVHRFTNKMADATHAVARILTDTYDGNAANVWNNDANRAILEKRIRTLPGFGAQKAAKMPYVLHYLGYRDFSNQGAE
ncbi:MAG: hypothetical protein ACE5G0_08165 [Rhodothermales bacterium]